MEWPTDDDAADARKHKVVRLKSNMVRASNADAKAGKKAPEPYAAPAAIKSSKAGDSDSDDGSSDGDDEEELVPRSKRHHTGASDDDDESGSDSGHDEEEEAKEEVKRKNKKKINKPQELTTKQRVSRLRPCDISGITVRKTGMDPRFEGGAATGLDRKAFAANYSFLDDLKREDVKNLTAVERQARHAGDETLLRSVQSLRTQYSEALNYKAKTAASADLMREYVRQEKERVTDGKKPFFLKHAAIKQLGAGQKFIDLADRGVIDQRLDKKRRKIVAKDKHYMPGQ